MIKGFKKAWDQVTGTSKLPPDQALIAAERKLTRLGSIVDVMRSNFTRYTELAIQLGDAGIIISNDVSVFYGNAKQKSRQASVDMFSKTQKSVAVSAAEEFRSQLRAGTNGIVDEFTAWTNDINNANALVTECQRVRQNAFEARLKLESTKEQLSKKRQNVGGVFGTSAGEIFDIEQRIAPLETQAKELEMRYNRMLQQVETTSY